MPKPPLNERIKALEDANALLIAKIDRMKAQVKHNQEVIRKMKKREDKQRSRMSAAAKYREGIDKRIEDCLRMNGKIP